jgi:guanylate kinase
VAEEVFPTSRSREYPLIAVVGPCASGKSSLVRALRARGYNAREVGQEHSQVADMWQRITNPDVLVFIDVSWRQALKRRPCDAGAEWWDELARRLRHAREHADICICTDNLTPNEVAETVTGQILLITGIRPEPSKSAS